MLRMNGATALLPIYAFMVWTGRTLYLLLQDGQMSNAWEPSNRASLSEVGEQINIIFISLKMEGLGITMF